MLYCYTIGGFQLAHFKIRSKIMSANQPYNAQLEKEKIWLQKPQVVEKFGSGVHSGMYQFGRSENPELKLIQVTEFYILRPCFNASDLKN